VADALRRAGALALAVALLCQAGAAAAAALYRWQDAEGRLHLTDTPPPPDARLLSKSHLAPAPPAAAPRTSAAEGPGQPQAAEALDVVMYATARCPYCQRARQYFRARGISWREIDIESSAQAEREFQALGGAGVPLIFVNGARIAGFDAGHLDAVISRQRRGARAP
jgi:glutaredoxin